MTVRAEPLLDKSLVRCEWDSIHFGFEVASITSPILDDDEVGHLLQRAGKSGYELVYWIAEVKRTVRSDILQQYAGRWVDRKVTYARGLDPATGNPIERVSFQAREFPVGPATDELISLAIAAGKYSRFYRDTRFPAAAAQQMYRTWMERSARREIADAVLCVTGANGNAVAMITVSRKGDAGQIGLVAVDASVRRAGIGKLLLQAAHQWCLSQGLRRIQVVTQAENTAACRLYERCGYSLEAAYDVYHFWPRGSAPLPQSD